MIAYLWDGKKQLKGDLHFGEHFLDFILEDFGETNLDFRIAKAQIVGTQLVPLYGFSYNAIEIRCRDGRSNVFVVDEEAHALNWSINQWREGDE